MWTSSLIYRKKEMGRGAGSTHVGRLIRKCPAMLSSKEKILQSSWSPEFPLLRRQEEEDKKEISQISQRNSMLLLWGSCWFLFFFFKIFFF